ncbi:hypothetical protein B566_EDAN014081 [Ephemera danica]|nr:hypothetical protein B566_EDAN014081 [Ephemera danica]
MFPTRGAGAPLVRAEEALIVLIVLVLWGAAIALFFNRWGKIRMLEPYQPKFQHEQHRASCPMLELTGPQHRTFSKFNLNACNGNEAVYASLVARNSSGGLVSSCANRPRQNSVFAGKRREFRRGITHVPETLSSTAAHAQNLHLTTCTTTVTPITTAPSIDTSGAPSNPNSAQGDKRVILMCI